MPNSCSAPGCKSNYTKEEHTPTFKMPEKHPEVRHAWIRALHREDIGHLKAVYVCLKDFHEEDILSTHKVPSGDGTFTEIPRARPMLREGAIPSLLPGSRSYYSTSSSKRTRQSFDSKEEDFLNQAMHLSLQSEEEDKEKFNVRMIHGLKQWFPTWGKFLPREEFGRPRGGIASICSNLESVILSSINLLSITPRIIQNN